MYSSPNIRMNELRRMTGGALRYMKKMRNTQNILVSKPEGDHLESNIKMDLKDTGREDMNWIHLAHDRVQ